MAIIEASGDNLGVVSSDEWDGYTIKPMDTEGGSGYKIIAATDRDILLRVAGIMIPCDSLSVQMTEDIKPIHGATRGRAYALAGGDIDANYSVEFGSWIEDGEQDVLWQALFEPSEGRAVYHTVTVTYLGDPAKGNEGRHSLLTLRKCKAKADSWNVNHGNIIKGKFDGLAIEMYWFGRKGV